MTARLLGRRAATRRRVATATRLAVATIPDLSGWWRGDSSPTTTVGAGIASWTDRSTAARNATQPTGGNQPTYVASPAPGGTFTTGLRLLSAAPTSAPAQTVFAVAVPTSNNAERTLRGSDADGGLGLRTVGGKVNLVRQGQFNIISGATTVTLNQLAIFAGDTQASGSRVYLNGAQDGSNTTGPGLTAGRTVQLGAGFQGGEAWNGTIFEVLQFDRVLTATERASVHSYLSDRYARTVADYLPA